MTYEERLTVKPKLTFEERRLLKEKISEVSRAMIQKRVYPEDDTYDSTMPVVPLNFHNDKRKHKIPKSLITRNDALFAGVDLARRLGHIPNSVEWSDAGIKPSRQTINLLFGRWADFAAALERTSMVKVAA